MNNIKKVLIPVDFSTASEAAINYAAGIVNEDPNIEVTLLNISTTELSEVDRSKLMEKLEALSKTRSKQIPLCRYEIQVGNLLDTILGVQERGSYHLIIMGTSGSLDENEGSRTSDLVLKADCPVLVVPENCGVASIKNIALALGHSPIDNSGGFQVLHDIARAFNATIHVLTVQSNGERVTVENENQRLLDYYFESLLYFHAFPKNSDIELGISDYVRTKGIDMVAIIPRNHVKNTSPSEGRLTKLLTLHAEVPLLTID